MAFQRVYDMEQADKLWEAGLLWRRWMCRGEQIAEWELDDTADVGDPARWSPTNYGSTEPAPHRSNYIQYAILLED